MRHLKATCALLTLTFLTMFAIGAELTPVRLPTEVGEKADLPHQVLLTALARGGRYRVVYPYGEIELLPLSTRIQDVRNGSIDVFYAMTSAEYEQEFQAIYVPIYRGLMGLRVAVINSEDKERFRHVKTIADLARFEAGQGKLWTDREILEANGLPTVGELKYPNLFRMLEAERFDYFPRGIHEPWAELAKRPELELMVDPYIMLRYTAPFYFFVHKSQTELAQHLTAQLHAMIADGSYLELFYRDKAIIDALAHANIARRTVINLTNPLLTPATPLADKKLWFEPEELAARGALHQP